MRILLIEDSERLRRSVASGLRKAGYAVDQAADGEEGLWAAQANTYDAIVLDLMLPRLDGLALLRQLRESGNKTHVLILTARDAVEDRVLGLRSGSDDYLVKPFAFDELLARVEALVRRSHGAKQPVLCIGGLEIDMARRVARRGRTNLDLPPREFALLELLALRQGQLVTRTQIESHIYDQQTEVMSNVVDSAIYSLRKKIDTPGEPSLIHTRRGMGYILESARP
ncbi:MAG TPA: response regulator transcription factor [Tepidisphaeraceae bacterium]|jgi:DNA-binding response OmpR family regulator|nr:response regulator transcription factor [Tepidisphaeraceae bacterium]